MILDEAGWSIFQICGYIWNVLDMFHERLQLRVTVELDLNLHEVVRQPM